MVHKFSQLINLRGALVALNEDALSRWLQELLAGPNGKRTVIGGVFRELYNQGDSNSDHFLQQLIERAISLHKPLENLDNTQSNDSLNESDENENENEKQMEVDYINNIPESLLCKVGSYLSWKDIFTSWNQVNRHFAQTGLKPETIESFEFTAKDCGNVDAHPPKFKFTSTLSKLKSITLNSDCARILDLNKITNWPQSITLYSDALPTLLRDVAYERIRRDGQESMSLFLPQIVDIADLQNPDSKVKRLLIDEDQLQDPSEQDIDDVLRVLVPQCPEKDELEQRLKTEITQDMKASMQAWEIEQIENEIKHEVVHKYHSFDENNVDPIQSWHSSFEMFSFGLSYYALTPAKRSYVLAQASDDRIKAGLSRLRSVHSRGAGHSLLGVLCNRIIQVLGSQLKVLHMHDDASRVADAWRLFLNNACTRESIEPFLSMSWFPANLTHLCVTSSVSSDIDSNHFWHRVNKFTFPRLKHLNIENTLDVPNTNYIFADTANNFFIGNLSSLIDNGLESLNLKLAGLELKDIYHMFTFEDHHLNNTKRRSKISIADFLNNLAAAFERCDSKQKAARFELKVELSVMELNGFYDDEFADSLADHCNSHSFITFAKQINDLYNTLEQRFDSVMYGFRIVFDVGQCVCYFGSLTHDWNQMLTCEEFFQETETCAVDCNTKYKKKDLDDKYWIDEAEVSLNKLLLGFVVKTKQSCDACHMTKYHYECEFCKPKPWLSFG